MEPLSPEEIRVLGCLIEKQLTTPQAYPLTESALITACNQTTNREPIVSYEQGTVRRTLLNLRQQGLARTVHRPGDRVEKHRHLLDEALSLTPAQVSVLAVLFLRGAQTIGELRARTERMHAFSGLDEIEQVLRELADRSPEPLVERMERQPGQKEARYRHRLGAVRDTAPVPSREGGSEPVRQRSSEALDALRAEVAELRERVARLEVALGEDLGDG